MKPDDLPRTAQGQRLAGVVTAAELAGSGWSPGQIRSLVSRGDLVRITRGVYAPTALARRLLAARQGSVRTAQTDDLRMVQLISAAAALAALAPGAVASHGTAARIHLLDVMDGPGKVTLSRTPGQSRSGRADVLIHSARLPADHVMTVLGVGVTTAARTVIDMARAIPFRDGVVLADSALRARQTSKAELRQVLAECRGWPGARRAGRVVEFADERSESALESVGRVEFDEHGLPTPELQAWVGGDEVVGRVDFYWPTYATVAEADGLMKYDDNPRPKIAAQIRRDNELRDAGFEIVHFTWPEITQDSQQVVDRIRAAFTRGERMRAS